MKPILKAAGYSEDINGLIAYANKTYGNANDWYDYLTEKGGSVSTGTDYTSWNNALNMFVAYHILKSAIDKQELVYMKTTKTTYWNYCNGGQPYDYYVTMLPNTLMKIWQPTMANVLFINRYVHNNTLTDEVGTYGSAAMHMVESQGVRITNEGSYRSYNGYIHSIKSMLVYDQIVPKGVLHERMRFDFASMQPEMNNNGWRFLTYEDVAKLNNGGSSSRLAFPTDYFENVRVLRDDTRLRYNIKGAYNAYMSDAMQSWGYYDLAVKLPALPTGIYEIRINFSPMAHGGKVEYSIGNDPDDREGTETETGIVKLRNFTVLDTLDLTIEKEDPRIGWTDYTLEEDLGIASDKAMRERGYMRGAFSYQDHPEMGIDGNYSQRHGIRNASLRRILGRVDFKQGSDNWLRMRSASPDAWDQKFQLDFIEFVPVDVVDNPTYMEDWY